MNLITAIKARLLHLAEEDEILVKKKKQFNVTIDEEIIDQVRYLASRYGAPLAPTAAHMLQVGAYYLANALEDTPKRETLSEHIIETHLLGIGPGDDPAIIVIGETSDSWKLLEYSKHVLRSYKQYCHAPKMTMKTGDVSYMKKAERGLLKAAVGFALLLQKRTMGLTSELSNDQGQKHIPYHLGYNRQQRSLIWCRQ